MKPRRSIRSGLRVMTVVGAWLLGVGSASAQGQQGLQSVTGSPVPTVPTVDATGTNPGSTGITGVTRTNLTVNHIVRARNFFLSGGLDLRPSYVAPDGTVTVAPAVAARTAPQQPPGSMREAMVQERARLLAEVGRKRRLGQPWGLEATQSTMLEAEIARLDREAKSPGALQQRGPGGLGRPAPVRAAPRR